MTSTYVDKTGKPQIACVTQSNRYNWLPNSKSTQFVNFPIVVPYVLRFLAVKPGNSGLVKSSSKLLTTEGFVYSFGVKRTAEQIFLARTVESVGKSR